MIANLKRLSKLAGQYLDSRRNCGRYREDFEGVERFCMFLGYPRSGHTLVCSILDAHPEVVIANELHALRYVDYGFSRDQLYYLLLKNSEEFHAAGQEYTGYSYNVPNQWQGRYRKLRVIGDKRADRSLIRLRSKPERLDRLQEAVGVEVRYIHIVRNPYDVIASVATKTDKKNFQESIDFFFMLAEGVTRAEEQIPASGWLEIRQETIVATPEDSIRKLCHYLGVEPDEGYVKDCAGIVFASPNKVRHKASWTPESIGQVTERMKPFPFFEGYSFES